MEDLVWTLVKPQAPVRRASFGARPLKGQSTRPLEGPSTLRSSPPWHIRSDQMSILEPELKLRCCSIAALPIPSFCGPALHGVPSGFVDGLTQLSDCAAAALREDPGLAAFFEAQVPS